MSDSIDKVCHYLWSASHFSLGGTCNYCHIFLQCFHLLYVLALDESIDQAVAIPPAGDEVGLTTVQCVMVTVVLVVVVVARSDQLI